MTGLPSLSEWSNGSLDVSGSDHNKASSLPQEPSKEKDFTLDFFPDSVEYNRPIKGVCTSDMQMLQYRVG